MSDLHSSELFGGFPIGQNEALTVAQATIRAQDEALGRVRAWCYKQIDDYDHTPYQEGLQDGAVDLLLDLAAAPAVEPEAGEQVTP